MIVMNVKIDNFLLFQNFEMNMAYPKKIVNSGIPNETLSDFPNFRYKKFVALMGANATGKTAFGKVLMGIFNFITRKEAATVTRLIECKKKEASFEIDFVFPEEKKLVRVSVLFDALQNEGSEYTVKDIHTRIVSQRILANDNYEKCVARMESKSESIEGTYTEMFEKVPLLTWHFEYPYATDTKRKFVSPVDRIAYAEMLKRNLRVLDTRIEDVTPVPENPDAYNVTYENKAIMINKGRPVEEGVLSSGTVEGIGIADIITSMKTGGVDFFFCDEKFSHVQSEIEKAYLSVMIKLIGKDRQLFVTTHNSDIAEMFIPFHSFAFLRRDDNDHHRISVMYASDLLKKNTESLKNAIDNDLFLASPNVEDIFQLGEV